jgi:cation:H+ antiporter
MLVALLLLLSGAAVLTIGAESAVRGAVRFAEAHGLSPFLLGAILFGVDIESLGAAVIAAGKGQTSIAAGEAFGTVVFLFSVAFGIALLLAGRPVQAPSPLMVILPAGALVAAALAQIDQFVSRVEGAALIATYVIYINLLVREERAVKVQGAHIREEAAEGPRLPPAVLALAGLALVYVGASLLVDGGVRILNRTSLAAGFVGAALIGSLAALDEVLLEVLPIRRGTPELATGNLFGTVAAFSTGVLGIAALVRPLSIDSAATSAFLAAAVLYTVVAVGFLARGKAGRLMGLLVLVLYVGWLVFASRL